MNADQYRRANSNSFNVCIVIYISGALLNLNNILHDGISLPRVLILFSILIGVGMGAAGKFKFATVKLGSILIMGGATIYYFVLLLAENDIVYFAFGLPILICSIIYLNVKLCKGGISAHGYVPEPARQIRMMVY